MVVVVVVVAVVVNVVVGIVVVVVVSTVGVVVVVVVVAVVVVVVVVVGAQSFPDDCANMDVWMALEELQCSQRVRAKDAAPLNMLRISFTLDTFHFEMSPLNDVASLNI